MTNAGSLYIYVYMSKYEENSGNADKFPHKYAEIAYAEELKTPKCGALKNCKICDHVIV